MKKHLLFILILLVLGVGATKVDAQALRVFISAQVGTNPVAGYVLTTDGTNSTWAPAASGGSSKWDDNGTSLTPTNNETIFVNGTSTLQGLITNNIKATTSAGLILYSSNGTPIGSFGVGASANTLLLGGLNIDGQTRLATSLSGLLQASAGVVSATATGTLTETVTGLEFDATRNVVGGSAVLSLTSGYTIPTSTLLANLSAFILAPSGVITAGDALTWSGNTLNFDGGATPSGDLGNTWASPSVTDDSHSHTGATLSGIDISSDTNLSGDTEIVLTGDTLSIASTIARDSELHSAVTLSGALDYITLVGQDIVRGAVDLATDITGVLGIANGGLGAAFTDPNADRLMFWDDSSGFITGIATLTGASISGTTLTINDVTCTDCLGTTEIADSYLLNNGDVGTGVFDFGGATSFEIVNGTAPTVDAIGEIALDTTDNQLIIATSTAAGAPGVLPITQSLGSFLIASTSQPFTTGFVSGVAIPFKVHRDGYTVTEIHCDIDGGTSIVINFDNGSGNTSTVTCDTDGASLIGVGSNAIVTAGSVSTAIETGTVTGTVNYLRVSVFGVYTRE